MAQMPTVEPLVIKFRRTGRGDWESVLNPRSLRLETTPDGMLHYTLEAERVDDRRPKGSFTAQVIIAQNYVASSDLRFLGRVEIDYRGDWRSGGASVTMVVRPGPLPELPPVHRAYEQRTASLVSITGKGAGIAEILASFEAAEPLVETLGRLTIT